MAKDKSASKVAKKSKAAGKKKKSRWSLMKFFRETVSELKKVSWPSTKDLTNHTTIVVVLILIFAVVIGLVDFGFGKLFTLIS